MGGTRIHGCFMCLALLLAGSRGARGEMEDVASLNCSANVTEEASYASCPYPETCDNSGSDDHVGLAFGLTIGAGLATTLGAMLPFVPFIKRSNTRYLAGGLALSAGVMLYVSFTEIWEESKNNFCCVTRRHFDLAATVSFFGGILITILLDMLVGLLQKLDCGCGWITWRKRKRTSVQTASTNTLSFSKHSVLGKMEILHVDSSSLILPSSSQKSSDSTPTAESLHEATEVEEIETPDNEIRNNPEQSQMTGDSDSRLHYPDGMSMTMSENTNNLANVSVNELFSNSSLLRMKAIIPETTSTGTSAELKSVFDSVSHVSVPVSPEVMERDLGGKQEGAETAKNGLIRRNSYQEMVDQQLEFEFQPQGPKEFREVAEIISPDIKRLKRMGILTALAIALHNFPEGLATFIATLSSPSLGIALAIAISLHNIPEGVCVAMPVYYSTGSKWKGFLWAFLSGVSEPLGALMGWLILKDVFGPLVYGISFGLIGGMMVFIALKELLPTALKFDKTKGKIVSSFLVIGMVIMAASLVLFVYDF